MEKENIKNQLGEVVITRGLSSAIDNNDILAAEVKDALKKYVNCNWGDTCPEDSELNKAAVENMNARIFAKYNTCTEPIYIITEYDRSYTTLMFSSEY